MAVLGDAKRGTDAAYMKPQIEQASSSLAAVRTRGVGSGSATILPDKEPVCTVKFQPEAHPAWERL